MAPNAQNLAAARASLSTRLWQPRCTGPSPGRTPPTRGNALARYNAAAGPSASAALPIVTNTVQTPLPKVPGLLTLSPEQASIMRACLHSIPEAQDESAENEDTGNEKTAEPYSSDSVPRPRVVLPVLPLVPIVAKTEATGQTKAAAVVVDRADSPRVSPASPDDSVNHGETQPDWDEWLYVGPSSSSSPPNTSTSTLEFRPTSGSWAGTSGHDQADSKGKGKETNIDRIAAEVESDQAQRQARRDAWLELVDSINTPAYPRTPRPGSVPPQPLDDDELARRFCYLELHIAEFAQAHLVPVDSASTDPHIRDQLVQAYIADDLWAHLFAPRKGATESLPLQWGASVLYRQPAPPQTAGPDVLAIARAMWEPTLGWQCVHDPGSEAWEEAGSELINLVAEAAALAVAVREAPDEIVWENYLAWENARPRSARHQLAVAHSSTWELQDIKGTEGPQVWEKHAHWFDVFGGLVRGSRETGRLQDGVRRLLYSQIVIRKPWDPVVEASPTKWEVNPSRWEGNLDY